MLYEVYKLGTRDSLKRVESKTPKEAVCLALNLKNNLLNIRKVEPYEANYCVKCINGSRNTTNYYYVTFNSVLMDARDYGYDLSGPEIEIGSKKFTYTTWVTIDKSFELWSRNVVGYTSTLLVNKEMGLLIESPNSMNPFDSHGFFCSSDFEKCVKRFKETGKFGLKCRQYNGYYSIVNNKPFDVEI